MDAFEATSRRDLAIRAAKSVADRVHGRPAQIRRSFVVRPTGDDELPAATRLLRGGRGGEVRLKLYLSLLWFAVAPPYDVTYPARAWATLLGLPDPAGAGARRVNEALKWLTLRGFIETQPRPGLASRIILRDETGNGRAYEPPGLAIRAVEDPDLRRALRYFQVSPKFWTHGWLAELSGAATAMTLVLLAESGSSSRPEAGVWFSPSVADARYGISSQTRTKGLRELEHHGLITTKKIPLALQDPFAKGRARNLYVLDTLGFNHDPEVVDLPAF